METPRRISRGQHETMQGSLGSGAFLAAREAVLARTALGCNLVETMKWGKPCDTLGGSSLALLFRLKACAAIGFLRGALLDDPKGRLVAPEEHSQAMRRLPFHSAQELADRSEEIQRFVRQALDLHRSERRGDFRQLQLAQELLTALHSAPPLRQAFYARTPCRQRGYALRISGAKPSTTRAARLAKRADRIHAGKGYQERWHDHPPETLDPATDRRHPTHRRPLGRSPLTRCRRLELQPPERCCH